MPAAFAALELRANAAVIGRLSNREVSVPALGLAFVGMFEDAGADLLDGMVESTQPRLTVSLADAAVLAGKTALVLTNPATLATASFEVVGSDPDGAGFIVYQLREVA
ncbi:MAG TPA: hypothetical protein VFF19_18315 [Reyranella sp.]|nr:hypothetical protein [Reyranella sp.]